VEKNKEMMDCETMDCMECGIPFESMRPEELQEIKERFFLFVTKLEERMKAFAETAIPELAASHEADTNEFKDGYRREKSAALGQLDRVMRKAEIVVEEEIDCFACRTDESGVLSAYYQFTNECHARVRRLDALYHMYWDKMENIGKGV